MKKNRWCSNWKIAEKSQEAENSVSPKKYIV